MKSIIISLAFSTILIAQINPLKSPDNIKLFADHLYCEQDYSRAAEEYKSLPDFKISDTILYKIGKCYSIIGDYDEAMFFFTALNSSSPFADYANNEIGKIYFLKKDLSSLDRLIDCKINSRTNLIKLKIALMLESKTPDFNLNEYITETDSDYIEISRLYFERNNPGYKSELLAGILSSVIPGSGKIYTENYGDGITAFILTGLFSYLAYDNFKHNHNFKGYLFSGIAAGFYFGNIYGSVASAQIFNVRVDFDFLKNLSDFISRKSYFTEDYDFCN
ncbi:MAG: hypothetical protein N3D80_14725 [Ignavibacterium album]|jgi:tetratricopeptide (TPR) repeat protein|uniref:tetratricopeptide repeat protein n=1 Tax=Ignavibacterium album TaxID=591197 RepID=UPI0026EC69F3|nr:hypothetical protein [Ignavibacterium album]MCX8107118.1 hypothetical protein [Ignavibacterium album]